MIPLTPAARTEPGGLALLNGVRTLIACARGCWTSAAMLAIRRLRTASCSFEMPPLMSLPPGATAEFYSTPTQTTTDQINTLAASPARGREFDAVASRAGGPPDDPVRDRRSVVLCLRPALRVGLLHPHHSDSEGLSRSYGLRSVSTS
jgi:hypothetical protein